MLPFAGEVIAAVGEVLGSSIVTVTLSELVRPPESVTEAVIVCVPTERTVENAPPEPIGPSRLEFQVRLLVRLPSSASLAVPEKFTVSAEV